MKRSISSSKDPKKAIFKHISANLTSKGAQGLTRQLEKMDAATLKRVFQDLDKHHLYAIEDILSSAAMGWAYSVWNELVELIQAIEQDPAPDLKAWEQRLTKQEREATDLPPHYAYTHLVLAPLLGVCLDDTPSDAELALENAALEGAHPTALLGLATTLLIEATPTLEAQRAHYGEEDEDYWDEDEDDDDDEDDDEDTEQLRALAIEGFTRCINNLCRYPRQLATQQLQLTSHLRPQDIQPALDTLYQLQRATISGLSLALDRVNLVELIKWSSTSLPLERLEIDLSKEHLADDAEQLERYELDLELLTQTREPHPLKSLTIHHARIKPGSLHKLLSAPASKQLESLTFTDNELDDDDAHTLATLAPATLKALCLDRNQLTRAGVMALAAAPQLQALDTFSMDGELLVVEELGQLRRSAKERFGELRSLLQHPPSEESWEQLCIILDLWPDMEQLEREIIPYVLSHIEPWPDAICVMPERWLLRLKHGDKVPTIGLIKSLDCDWLDEDGELFTQVLVADATLKLKSLTMPFNMQLSATMIEAFTQRPAFTDIESLRLFSYEWDAPDNTLRALFKADYPKLTTLQLWGYGLPEIFDEVLSAPYINQLTALEFVDTELELNELKQLKATGVFARLERFALTESELTPAELKALLKTPAPHLKHLNLSTNQLTAKALEGLLTSVFGEQLIMLDFSYNSLTRGDPFASLTEAKLRLERLNLSNTNLTNKAISTLAKCEWLSQVKSLDLTENGLSSSKGLITLLKSPHLSNLEELLLGEDEDFDDEVYLLISRSTTLPEAIRAYYSGYTHGLDEA